MKCLHSLSMLDLILFVYKQQLFQHSNENVWIFIRSKSTYFDSYKKYVQ